MVTNQPILYPQVTSLPGANSSPQEQLKPKVGLGEFDHVFDRIVGRDRQGTQVPSKASESSKAPQDQQKNALDRIDGANTGLSRDLSQVKEPLKFSAHATQRLKDRNISIDPEMMGKLSRAVDQAEAYGLEDALVLSDKAAFIVSVKNKTVVTALERGAVSGNVFTNIDGAVIV